MGRARDMGRLLGWLGGETGAADRSIRSPRKAKAIEISGFSRLKKAKGTKEVAATPSVAAM